MVPIHPQLLLGTGSVVMSQPSREVYDELRAERHAHTYLKVLGIKAR